MYSPELIMDLPLSVAVDFITHALEKEKDQAAWDVWSGIYPYMSMGWIKQIKFNEFKDKLFDKQHAYTIKSKDEIIAEFDALIARKKGGCSHGAV